MAKDDAIKIDGVITAVLPGTMFRVDLPNGKNVLAQPLTYVLRVRIAGSTESAPRHPVNVIVSCELRCEVVKDMRSVSASCQQHHCSP